jgi:hypothetical protein
LPIHYNKAYIQQISLFYTKVSQSSLAPTIEQTESEPVTLTMYKEMLRDYNLTEEADFFAPFFSLEPDHFEALWQSQ